MVEVSIARRQVFLGLRGEQQSQVTTWTHHGESPTGKLVQKRDPLVQGSRGDTVARVFACQHGVIRRVAEDQVAAACLGGEPGADIMRFDLRPRRLQVVGQAATAHRLANVNCGSTAGHGVNDQSAGGRIVVQCVSDDGRRDRTRMGDAKGTVVPERPNIIRRGPEIGRESIAAAQIFIRCMDGFGAGIKLSNAATARGSSF